MRVSKDTEIELRLAVPDAARAVLSAYMREALAPSEHLQAHYMDTADRRLARAGLSLRLRRENDRWIQTLKAKTAHGPVRFEHQITLPVSAGGLGRSVPEIDPLRHAGTAAGDQLLALCASQRLSERCCTDVRRQSHIVASAEGRVLLSWDQGEIRAGQRVETVSELEIELLGGSRSLLIETAQDWVSRHGLWLEMRSKAERGWQLSEGHGASAGSSAVTRGLDLRNCNSVHKVFRKVLGHVLPPLLPVISLVAHGGGDAEAVHQLRVGLRRLRTALRFFDGLVADIDPTWEATLAERFRQLGEARDAAALDDAIVPLLQGAGAPWVHLPRAPETLAPARFARATDLHLTVLALQAVVWRSAGAQRMRRRDLARVLGWKLHVWHLQFIEEAPRWTSLDESTRHRLRRRLKRLRYALEFMGSVFPAKRVARLTNAMAALQAQLGAYNDLVMAIDRYQAAVKDEPRAWFAVGWLKAQQAIQSRTCATALRAFRDVPTCWSDD